MSANLIPAVLSRHRGTDVAGIDFVVVDVETTGVKAVLERVVEVAAIRIRDGEVIDEFSTLVNPSRKIHNTKHHGITTKDVDSAPTWAQIAPTLLSHLSGAVMVCHNAEFDHVFLLARALRVTLRDLLGEPVLVEDEQEHDDVPAIRDALMAPQRLSRTLFASSMSLEYIDLGPVARLTKDDDALHTLLSAEQKSPGIVRHSAVVREIVRSMYSSPRLRRTPPPSSP